MLPTCYKPIHFCTEEFVDRKTFEQLGEAALGTMDVRILITADKIREYLGTSVTINNWKWGKDREWSGLRTVGSPFYSPYSQHSFGRAIDFIVNGMQAQSVRNLIKANPKHEAFQYITRMEEFPGMSWIHVDCCNWNKENGIFVFKP